MQHELRKFAGISVYNLSVEEAVSLVDERITTQEQTLLMFANSNFIVKNQETKHSLDQKNILILNDGISIDIASRILYGSPFKANLNGTDFTPTLLSRIGKAKRIALVGSLPGVATEAARNLELLTGCNVVAIFDGYRDMEDKQLLFKTINSERAEIVLIGLGNPMQEKWMLENSAKLDARLVIGVGALFDFLSNRMRRAPEWMRKCKIEWFFRLANEPKRLLRRYTIDGVYFFWLCLRK